MTTSVIISNGMTVISPGHTYFTASSTTSVSKEIVAFDQLDPSKGVHIGPSDCNNDRDNRTRDADRAWHLVDPTKFIRGQLVSALDLFREALSCYQNGAFLASCIMCRTAIESMLYIVAKSTYDVSSSTLRFDPGTPSANGRIKRMKYSQLLSSGSKFLEQAQIKWLKEDFDPGDREVGVIRHSGDVVAHYSEKLASYFTSSVNSTIPVELWKGEKSTLNILMKTAQVIQTVSDKYKVENQIL